MTRHERLALTLIGTDPRDSIGDDQAPAEPSLVELLDASVHDAMMTRIRLTEKRVQKLYELPEVAAMLARQATREGY